MILSGIRKPPYLFSITALNRTKSTPASNSHDFIRDVEAPLSLFHHRNCQRYEYPCFQSYDCPLSSSHCWLLSQLQRCPLPLRGPLWGLGVPLWFLDEAGLLHGIVAEWGEILVGVGHRELVQLFGVCEDGLLTPRTLVLLLGVHFVG